MRIAVCFKTIPEFEMLTEQDWQVGDGYAVDVRFARQSFNCFDESALELALKLSDRLKSLDRPVELTALTIDDEQAERFLKQLFAVQYDHAVRLDWGRPLDLRFDPLAVARLIAAYVEQIGGQQLLFLGRQGAEGDNGQTGFLAAERLGWPCIREVVDVAVVEPSGWLKVTSRLEAGTLVQTVTPPLVLVIGNTPHSPYLRVPTIKQKLAAAKREIAVLSGADLGFEPDRPTGNDKTLVHLERRRNERRCIWLEGEDSRQKAQRLFDSYLKERLI